MPPGANVRGSAHAAGIGAAELCDPFDAAWNRSLGSSADATIFHTTEWARVLADTYGYTPYYFNWQNGGRSIRFCLWEIDSWLTGCRAVSVPFADEGQILGVETPVEIETILQTVRQFACERGWKRVEIRGAPEGWSDSASSAYYAHALDLRPGVNNLFQGCTDSVRRAVRKAERAGVSVEIRKDAAAIEEYFDLHCLTRKKHGVPPQPLKFFRNISRHVIAGGLGFTALARLNGRALAGAVFFFFQGKALYKFGASDPRMDAYRPSNLVMWKGIQQVVENGAETLSLGRTDLDHEGLRRYKLGWGVKEKRISYLQYDPQSETFLAGRSRTSSNRLFSILPTSVLKQIGAILYPHIG